MSDYAGLDVSLKETAICLVDESGKVVGEGKVASEPEAIVAYLRGGGRALARVGLEAGPLVPWLYGALVAAGLPAICLETRRMKAALKAMPVKTDRKDAEGIAQVMRTGWFRAVHVKSRASYELRMLLRNRHTLLRKRLDIENEIRGTLKGFGLKVGTTTVRRFDGRVRELVGGERRLAAMVAPMLEARAALLAQFLRLHRMVLAVAHEDPVCRRLMTVPGVGPVTALAYKTGVEVPARFAKSATVGAHFGLTPRRYKSGEIDRSGRISKCGDALVRSLLYEAANSLLTRVRGWSWLKRWAMEVAKRRGIKKAKVALARRLAVILHRIWVDGCEFHWTRAEKAQATA